MALAVLKSLGVRGGEALFEADIGTNTYYRWAVGSGRELRDGFQLLDRVRYESPLQARGPSRLFGSEFRFGIPSDRFDRDTRYVQLTSFGDASGRSPAWSRVLEIWPQLSLPPPPPLEVAMTTATTPGNGPHFEPCRRVASRMTENRLSGAMFWDQLLGIAEVLAPKGSELLARLVNQRTGGQVDPSNIQNIISSLLQVIGQAAPAQADAGPATRPARANGGGAGSGSSSGNGSGASPNGGAGGGNGAAPLATGSTAASLRQHLAARGPRGVGFRQLRRRGAPWLGRAQVIDGGVISGPALIGLITTLGPSVLHAIKPLLERSPELAKAYLDSPLRLFNAISEANRQEQQLTNQQVNSLLNAGNQALLFNLLHHGGQTRASGGHAAALAPQPASATSSLSVGSEPRMRRQTRRVDRRIQAALIAPASTEVAGHPRVLYALGEDLAFRFALRTSLEPPAHPIPKLIAQLRITDPLDGRSLHERRFQLRDVHLNQAVDLELHASEIDRLPARRDLLASLDVSWLGSDGQVHTTEGRAMQGLYLTGEYALKSVGRRSNQKLPLNAPDTYRAFWQRIWEGGSRQHRRWEFEATARYYYRLRPGEFSNGRVAPRFKLVEESPKKTRGKIRWEGLVKGGLELAPGELNKLLPLLGHGEAWPEEQLDALASEDFAKCVDQQATVSLKLRGRSEERGCVWVFPVMDLVEVELLRVTATGERGEVTETETVRRRFPVPVSAVFVGMQNKT